MSRGTLLILSFSPIASDARVLKQVQLFKDLYEVTTCGFGPAPDGVAHHVEIPAGLSATDVHGRLITLRWYGRAYWSTTAIAHARRVLPVGAFDAVLANDLEAVPLALALRPRRGVHADLHEYAPAQHDEIVLWKRRIAPYKAWLCRKYVTRAVSTTTVSQGIADEYRRVFGIDASVVTNAAPFHDLAPGPVGTTIRVVHSGVAQRKRHLDALVDAVAQAEGDLSLDLFLVPNEPAYLAELEARIAELPEGRVRLHPPVPYARLIETLNGYDVGLTVLPSVNFNNLWALPNKLFDYVQARLAVIVGPSPEMSRRVEEWGVGRVADDFTAASLAAVLGSLTREQVEEYKRASHAKARAVASENEVLGWRRAVDALFDASGGEPS